MGDTDAPADQLPSGRVTFLFTDIEGSTRLACELGADYRRMLHDHHRLLRTAFARHTGSEVLTEGDSFFVAFQDAETALRAALDAQRALAEHEWPTSPEWTAPARPRVRMGLHTGQAIPDRHGYASSAVHRAARVCGAAHGDQILCSLSTIEDSPGVDGFASVVDLGLYVLRGFDDRERLFQVNRPGDERSLPPRASSAAPRRHDLPSFPDPFVGRETELERLAEFMATRRLTTVTSLPGTGRTRLICRAAELAAPDFHDGVWYVPVARDASAIEAIAEAFGVRPDPFRPVVEAVVETLRVKRCLLVLDDVTPSDVLDVERLITGCPGTTILAAGRSPLKLPGEVKWPLPPMDTADAALLLRRLASVPDDAEGDAAPDPFEALAGTVDAFLPALRELATATKLFGPAMLLLMVRKRSLDVVDDAGRLSVVVDDMTAHLTGPARELVIDMSEQEKYSVDDLRAVFERDASSERLNALLELVDTAMVTTHQEPDGVRYQVPAPIRWRLRRRFPRESTSVTIAHEPLHSPERMRPQADATMAAWMMLLASAFAARAFCVNEDPGPLATRERARTVRSISGADGGRRPGRLPSTRG